MGLARKNVHAASRHNRTGFVRGDGVQLMTQDMRRRVDMSRTDAERLIRTESNYAFNQGSLANYINSGAEYIEFIATWDGRTSQICMDMDGAIIPLNIAAAGANIPPMHPNCRSCIAAYFGAAHPDESRKTADAAGNELYLSDGEHIKDRLAKMSESELKSFEMEQKQALRAAADHDQYERYKKTLGPDAPSSFEKFRDIKYNNPEAYKELTAFNRYKTLHPETDLACYRINNELKARGIKTSAPLPPERVKAQLLPIYKAKNPYHAHKRMVERHIGTDEAQSYINNARIMFNQRNGVKAYYSDSGVTVVIKDETNNWLILTLWDKSDFDESADYILEVARKYGK